MNVMLLSRTYLSYSHYQCRQPERSDCCGEAYISHRQKLPRSLLPRQALRRFPGARANSPFLCPTSLSVSLSLSNIRSTFLFLCSLFLSLLSRILDLATASSSKLSILFSHCFAPEPEMLTASFLSIPCRSFKV